MKDNKRIKIEKIIGIIFATLLLVVALYIIITTLNKDENQKPSTALLNSQQLDYSYLEINILPYSFAEYKETKNKEKYYFALDKNNTLYIVYMDTSLYNNLEKIDLEKSPYTLIGLSYNIPQDIKKLAIEVYNEDFKNILTEDNFEQYFGKVFLDTTYIYQKSLLSYLIATILIITSLFINGYFIKDYYKQRKTKVIN